MQHAITSITQAIGNTPLLRLDRLKSQLGFEGNIFAKLEYLNPSFSKKDRIAVGMLELAEQKGLLKPGQPVLEMTSGNTGTSFALVCAAKGYRFICVMSRGNSTERMRMIKALGGELVLVDQSPASIKGRVSGADMLLVEKEAERLVEETGAFFINQFKNHDNPDSQGPAAREMWEQSGRSIEVFADFVGTGGTFTGYAEALLSINPNIHCYVVEPYGCAFYKGEVIEGWTHGLQGGGYAKEMDLVDRKLLTGAVVVTDDEAREMSRMLARQEGVFAGFTSGANVVAATKLLQEQERGKNIGVVVNDCGLKYMSTDLY